jgi:hypothetical protein
MGVNTVREANDKYFSPYTPNSRYKSAIEQGLASGSNEYMVFHQDGGTPFSWSSSTRFLHLEKDKDYIISEIRKYAEESKAKDAEAIKRAEYHLNEQKARAKERYKLYLSEALDFIKANAES